MKTDLASQHEQLADYAASQYDNHYLSQSCKVKEITNFEQNILLPKLMEESASTKRAVELGCGTGRISIEMAPYFETVDGFDISGNMIEEAKRKVSVHQIKNASFTKADINHSQRLVKESISLLFAGFGFGSFVTDIFEFMSYFISLLEIGSLAYISFYNQLHQDASPKGNGSEYGKDNELKVLVGGKEFLIPIQKYTCTNLLSIISRFHDVSLMALNSFPQVLTNPFGKGRSKYMVMVLKKTNFLIPVPKSFLAFPRFNIRRTVSMFPDSKRSISPLIKEILVENNLIKDVIDHEKVRTMRDVQNIFPAIDPDLMGKSVLLSVNVNDVERYCLCVIPSTSKVNKKAITNLLYDIDIKITENDIKMLSPQAIVDVCDQTAGCITPFGMPENVIVLIDSGLKSTKKIMLGIGSPYHSLFISLANLKKITNATVVHLSRDSALQELDISSRKWGCN
jgi:prolyl-tRNA editing enzyme YbaK/EbsC (Cys-tRNA(Pro) deacylase)